MKALDAWNQWVNDNPDLFLSVERVNDFSQIEIIARDINSKLVFKENDKVLDVGCGSGLLLSRLVNENKIQAVGTDISEAQIRIANKNFHNIHFLVNDAEHLSFKNSSFNKILCYSVFHLISNWKEVIDSFINVATDDGMILIGDIPDKKLKYKYYWYILKTLPSLFLNFKTLRNKFAYNKNRPRWIWVDLDKVCNYIKTRGFNYKILTQPQSHRQFGTASAFYRVDLLIYKKHDQ